MLQLCHLCLCIILSLFGFASPFGVIAFQLLVGFTQMGAGGVPLSGQGGDLLFQIVHFGAVHGEYLLYLIVIQPQGFEVFGFHTDLLSLIADSLDKAVGSASLCG